MASVSTGTSNVGSRDSGKTETRPNSGPKVTQKSFGPLGLGTFLGDVLDIIYFLKPYFILF